MKIATCGRQNQTFAYQSPSRPDLFASIVVGAPTRSKNFFVPRTTNMGLSLSDQQHEG